MAQLTLSYDLPSLASSSSLIDRRVAGSGRAASDREVGAGIVELEVISRGSVLDEIDLVLRVSGVGVPKDVGTLVAVVARAGDRKRLINLAALGVLLTFLAHLGYGREGGDD